MAKIQYGVTPWGAWFIEVLNSYEMGARLGRGKTYANTGRVLSLDFEDGRASAKVEGNYRPFYRVEIVFPALKEREKVYGMIDADPGLLARIAAGELPEEFLEKLKAEGISLIPKKWRDMKRSCSCPDDGDPCKHMAALYYIIAREVDADPRLLFRLRGMDLEARFGLSVALNLPAPFTVSAAQPGKKVPDALVPSAETMLGAIPHCAELIVSLLPPKPPFGDRDFALTLADFYHRAARFSPWESADEGDDGNDEAEHRYSRSRWSVLCPNPGPGEEVLLEETDILGKKIRHTLFDVCQRFVNFSSDDGTADYTFLFYLFKFLNQAAHSCAFIPFVLLKEGILRIIWKPYEALPQVAQALDALAFRETGMLALNEGPGRGPKKRAKTAAGKKAGPAGKGELKAGGRSVVDLLSSAFMGEWVKRNYFAFQSSVGSREYQELLALFFQGASMGVSSPALRSIPVSIDRWLSVLHINFSTWKYRFTVKDVRKRVSMDSDETSDASPDSPLGELDESDTYTLSMDALFETPREITKVPLMKIASGKKLPGGMKIDTLAALRAPTALSNYLPEIRSLMVLKKTSLSEKRLAEFLESASPLLTRLGIGVDLPKSLHRELKPRLVPQGTGKTRGGGMVSFLRLDSLLDWQWQVAVGNRILSIEEFEKLLKQKRDLIRFKDGFVRLNIQELAALLKKAKTSDPGVTDFLKAHFAGDSILSFDAEELIKKLFEERRFSPPAALQATLRPYQKRGYNWACSLLLSGFGCVLADDMGLGKTIQAISVLLRLKEDGFLGNRCLIVAPAALLENWERELSRFAPSLAVCRYHGTGRKLEPNQDVFLTTYQTAARDSAKLQKEPFSLLIVDEAHLMKNADTGISRAVKKLQPQYRLALSGTPVENRLEDLRSLFDFIIPGYLGGAKEFKDEYRYPIEVLRNREKAEALKKITSPFLLRRLKTDKTIIKDLPDKIVTNEYAVLEKEQAALYEGMVNEIMQKSEDIDPKDRPALVLTLLTALKQICDHPRVYDKESPAVSALSGKAQLLKALLEEILAGREKTLIFSQYVETLDCLSRIILKELGEPVLIYHGSMTQKARSEALASFSEDPASRILLVSLKAGGLGLNLTAASRVIHYDLWYNPAVENQATDRAFRIGQKRNVFVHRLITKNSFEEKIDAMLSNKKELAEMTVSSGESWLARMSHQELKALFEH